MLAEQLPHLARALSILIGAKSHILSQWMAFDEPRLILEGHHIKADYFIDHYAGGVFDYFMDVIYGRKEVGDCPVMADLLEYLKDREVSADELFIICSHFRKAIIDYSYDSALNSKELFDEVSYLFDLNFSGVLKRYTDTIYQKELEIERNVKLLNEYKKAIDASAIVSKMDLEGRITFVNDNFCEVSGYSREELLGKAHRMILASEEESVFDKSFLKTIPAENVYNASLQKQRKDGSFFYVDSTIVPIIGTDGSVSEYIVIGYEVTTLIEAKQEAVEAGLSKEYFLSNMSHEIRTPLNAILGFVGILQDEVESSKHRKYLDIVLNSGENLLNIINDILDFSKLQSGEFTIEKSRFNLHEELSHTLELFAASANEKEITMLSYIDPNIPYELEADPLRIKQIIANFISNAIKFTPPEGVVELEAFCEKGVLRVSIKDTGVGIEKEDQAKIFDAFTQVKDGRKSISGGTGLGLAICKQLAQHMDGDVYVASEVGQGSTFTLEIPVQSHEKKTLEMFDIEPFRRLTMAMLQKDGKLSKRLLSLHRYLNSFDLDVVYVDEPSTETYDLLFFSDGEINEAIRAKITDQKLPAIAIMEYFDNRYEETENITPLYFPIYCSKLYHTLLTALHLTKESDAAGQPVQTRKRQFEGRVLVAEDNSANQELIKIILESYGLRYVIASDGEEALIRFKEDGFDLVLMDEQMPNMNGTEATKEIRRIEKKHAKVPIPIVALTANVLKGEKEKSRANGFDAFLGKPVVLKEVEAVFAHFLKEKKSEKADAQGGKEKAGDAFKGIDTQRLAEELMLDADQVLYLMEVYSNKMRESLKELKKAIAKRDYNGIAKLAHSVKGSSSNFRIETIVDLAYAMEKAAYDQMESFDYEGIYASIAAEFEKIVSRG